MVVTHPTVLSPWYVVQQRNLLAAEEYEGVLYYQSSENAAEAWTTDKRRALLFMSLPSAARVASAEGAEVRVLTSKQEGEEFYR